MRTRELKWIACVKKISKWLVVVLLLIYAAIFVLDKKFPDKFYDCEYDTNALHGGIKIYGEKRYSLVVCGVGGDENFMNDKIRLQVFSEKGELLAQRKFHIDWMMTNFPKELKYGPDYVIYYDNSQQSNFEHRISMPPTWWDWARARLPLMN